jgi:membrane protease subunit HflK
VLRNVNKVMVDKNGGPGVVPYLPLPELKPAQSAPSLPRSVPPPPPPTTGGTR